MTGDQRLVSNLTIERPEMYDLRDSIFEHISMNGVSCDRPHPKIKASDCKENSGPRASILVRKLEQNPPNSCYLGYQVFERPNALGYK